MVIEFNSSMVDSTRFYAGLSAGGEVVYEYTRDVYYYETDKMGVVHHSNFIRWLEEARTCFFNDAGIPYSETEAFGIFCPVTEFCVKYKHFARFGESFTVRLMLTKYTGVRFTAEYAVVNGAGETLLEGESRHAFVNADFRPVPLSRALPERHEVMKRLVESGGILQHYSDTAKPRYSF